MSDAAGVLKWAQDAALANPAFQPANGVTHCNQALVAVAHAVGCAELDGLMADGQCAMMAANASGRWKKVSGSDAAVLALSGNLVVAAMSSTQLGEAHGHVASLYPLGMQFSGSLNRDVPMVANVGKTVGVMKSTAAFPVDKGEADYFAWA